MSPPVVIGSSSCAYEIEEEFDPALLGFPSTSTSTSAWPSTPFGDVRSSSASPRQHAPHGEPLPEITRDAKCGTVDDANATVSKRGAMDNLSRSVTPRRPRTGRYTSADWLPPVDMTERRRTPEPTGQEAVTVDLQERSFAKPTDDAGSTHDPGALLHVPHPALQRPLPNGEHHPVSPSQVSAVPDVDIIPSKSSDASDLSGPSSKHDIRLSRVRLPGRKAYRWALKVRRRRGPPEERGELDEFVGQVERALDDAAVVRTDEIPEPPPPPLDSIFQRDLVAAFGADSLNKLSRLSKLHNTSGDALPSQLRDLFPALADPKTAISLANDIRAHLDLPPLSLNTDKVALRRAIATMREKVYVEVASALVLPLAPPAEEEQPIDEDDIPIKEDMSLTPMSLDYMEKVLPKRLPADKAAIKAFLAKVPNNIGAAYGEIGQVVWERGVGRMASEHKNQNYRRGYHGLVNADGFVHVFVDQ